MSQSKSRVISHVYARIANLAKQALNAGLIVQCSRTPNNTYLLLKPGELAPTEYSAISTGAILISLLKDTE